MVEPRILILSASVGAGHLRAAEALQLTLGELAPLATIKSVDVLTLTNVAFRRIYGKAYLDLVNKAPHVLGIMYDIMDAPRPPKNAVDRLRLLVERINLTKFSDMLDVEHWDVIVNTHFLPAEIIAHLRRDGRLHVKQITVTTDFDTHRLWVNQPCERYTTATAEGAEYLKYWGVPPEHIHVTGIPIHPDFARLPGRDECLSNQGLVGDRPIVLQLAGGFGVGPIEKLFRAILSVEHPIELAVVAGRNEEARRKLLGVDVPARHRVKIIGFTSRIHELMNVADVVVTKPGGLTSSEVLSCGAAMAIVNPIPGQEVRNNDYLLENVAAIKVNNIPTLSMKLNALLNDRPRLALLKGNARRIAHPRAAYDIARLALDLCRVQQPAYALAR